MNNPTVSGTIVQYVAKGSTTTLTSSPNPSAFGQDVTFTATVSGDGGTPTGKVIFWDNGNIYLGPSTLTPTPLPGGEGNSVGVATRVISSLPPGTHSVTAIYTGDGTFFVSTSAACLQTVSSVELTSSPNPSVLNTSVTFTAVVHGSSSTPTGTVTFSDGSSSLGTATLQGGWATLTTILGLPLGLHPITVAYSGDSNNAEASGGPLAQYVKVTSTITELTASANPSHHHDSVIFTADVSGTANTPTGQVVFEDGGSFLGASTLSATGEPNSGVATIPTSACPPDRTRSGPSTRGMTSTSGVWR